MTKKHFRALAEALHRTRPENKRGKAWGTWLYTVQEVGYVCKRDNYNFDWNRFMDACENGL